MTKILISPGYGAGWSTWAHGGVDQHKFWLTHKPTLDFIEKGGVFKDAETRIDYEADGNTPIYDALHPVLRKFVEDYVAAFPDDEEYFYFGGARGLIVTNVSGPFMVDEYDGAESLTTSDDFISLP